MSEELKAAQARIACLEGEIAKRDARIVELESAAESLRISRDYHHDQEVEYRRRWAGLYASPVSDAKAQGVVQWPEADEIMQMAFEEGQPADDASGYCFELEEFDLFIERLMSEVACLNAAPVSDAKAQGEYGDAYQGAREDLAIWKRRALEAEKALQEERIITERLGNALNEENGPTFMGEPVFPAKAKGVVMPERWNVPRPMWKDARQPYGNPLNHADIEAAEKFNLALDEVARLNAAPVQQVSVPDVSAMARTLADRSADACNVNREDNWAIHSQDYIDDVTAMLAAAPAAPAADACKACKGTGRRPIGGRGRIFGLTNRCFECQPLTDEEVYGQVTAHE